MLDVYLLFRLTPCAGSDQFLLTNRIALSLPNPSCFGCFSHGFLCPACMMLHLPRSCSGTVSNLFRVACFGWRRPLRLYKTQQTSLIEWGFARPDPAAGAEAELEIIMISVVCSKQRRIRAIASAWHGVEINSIVSVVILMVVM